MSQREVEHFVNGAPAVACIRCRRVFTPELERTRVTLTLSHTSGPPQVGPADPDPEVPPPLPVPTVLAEPNELVSCCFDCLPYVEAAVPRLFDVGRQPGAPQPATESEQRVLAGVALVDDRTWLSALEQEYLPARSVEGVARAALALRGVEAPPPGAVVDIDPRHPGSLEAQLLKVKHPRP